ncbi:unnamed protein product [Anisakis simplex]|uniref:ZP domain-containing protein n=1 Tax=Anisakis simplex TaxID=6269 RepID=A0A0M3K2B7_ANISI|nr:unnamed protein product [Anisakis simplex]
MIGVQDRQYNLYTRKSSEKTSYCISNLRGASNSAFLHACMIGFSEEENDSDSWQTLEDTASFSGIPVVVFAIIGAIVLVVAILCILGVVRRQLSSARTVTNL